MKHTFHKIRGKDLLSCSAIHCRWGNCVGATASSSLDSPKEEGQPNVIYIKISPTTLLEILKKQTFLVRKARTWWHVVGEEDAKQIPPRRMRREIEHS